MGEFARFVDERMAERHLVLSEGGVAEVPEEYPFLIFATKITKATKAISLIFVFYVFFVAKSSPDGGEYVRKRRRRSRFCDPVRRFSRIGVVGEDRSAGAVLAAVVLLLHEERELRSAIIARGDGGPAQDHHRHGAFVL